MRTIFAAALLAVFSGAQAYYEVRADAPAPQPEPNLERYTVVADRRVQALNYVGTPNAEVAAVSAGYGEGVNLDTALKMLLPGGWRAAVGPNIDRNADVRWNSGIAWPQALEQIARQRGLSITIFWQKKVALVDPMPPEAMIGATASPSPATYTAPPSPRPLPVPMTQAMPEREYAVQMPASPRIAGVPQPPPPPATIYRDLHEFLEEEIRVDESGSSLLTTLQHIVPQGWTVDFRTEDDSIQNLRFDLTWVGSRGEALNAIGKKENLQIIPYVEFRKLIVSRGI